MADTVITPTLTHAERARQLTNQELASLLSFKAAEVPFSVRWRRAIMIEAAARLVSHG